MTEPQDWDERYAGAELLWSAEPNAFVATELADVAPGTALDVGCGEGRNAIWLASRGWSVTGLDFSSVALSRAADLASRAAVVADWQQVDLRAWQPVGLWDLVLVAYVHLDPASRRELVSRCRAAVAAGGRLLLVGHDLRNHAEGTGGPPDPAVLWQPSDVPADGWDVLRSETAARSVGELTAWDTVVHLRRPV